MAIFGSLKQISLADLLPLLKSQRGSLEIFNLEGLQRVTLFVESGRLIALYLRGKPVDEVQVRSIFGSLMSARRGNFEFVPGVSPPQRHPKGWSLDRLMLSVTTMVDEISGIEEELPHPDTVFRLSGGHEPEDGRVADFWDKAKPELVGGASARSLSRRLGVPLEHTRYYLLKLRQAGIISPVRAGEKRRTASRGVASRLLGALRKRFWGSGSALGS